MTSICTAVVRFVFKDGSMRELAVMCDRGNDVDALRQAGEKLDEVARYIGFAVHLGVVAPEAPRGRCGGTGAGAPEQRRGGAPSDDRRPHGRRVKVPESVEDRRVLKGLVRNARQRERYRARIGLREWEPRELVGHLRGKAEGRCLWCREPVEKPRTRWHTPCAVAYLIARGEVRHAGGGPFFVEGDCVECGLMGTEVDHVDSLGAAARSGSWRRRMRAFTIGNLRSLCRLCHVQKTATDRREQREQDSPQMRMEFDGADAPRK